MAQDTCIICKTAPKRPDKPFCHALKCQIEYATRVLKQPINTTGIDVGKQT